MEVDVRAIVSEYKALRARKAPWENIWDIITKFVRTRKQKISEETSPGDFLIHGDIFDSTSSIANSIMCSSLIGALWRNGAKTFRIVKAKHILETDEVKKFFEEQNRRLIGFMEHPRAGLEVAIQEYMLDQGAYGTSGIGVFPARSGEGNIIEYKAFCVKYMTICEGASGYVNRVFNEQTLNAQQLVEEYGDEVSDIDEVKAALDAYNYDTKFKVLWVIRPRKFYNPAKLDTQNMPYESIHVLMKADKVVRYSGFKYMPIKVARFYKNQEEEYGRSPAMEALPDIVEINAIKELLTQAAEKQVHPPLYILDDGSFGGGIIDTSPNSVTPINIGSRITNTSPIGVIGTVGELNSTMELYKLTQSQIMSHFFVDRLLDLNNKTRMTLGEAEIRNELRSESLGSIFGRQLNELYTPLIETSYNMCFDTGELGVIPGSDEEKMILAQGKEPLYIPEPVIKAIQSGQDIYEIQYISPAARMLKAGELRGLMGLWEFIGNYSQLAPEMMPRVNAARSVEMLAELSGAPLEVLESEEGYKQAIEAMREAQTMQTQMVVQNSQAEVENKQAASAQQLASAQAAIS